MLRFFGRNALFFLFPAVIVALVFIGRIVLSTAMSIGEWGARSVVESTLLVAEEKVTRVEDVISSTDHAFFRIVDPADPLGARERWRAGVERNRLIEAAAIFSERGELAECFCRDEGDAPAIARRFVDEVLPLIDKYESLHQHKHLHVPIDGQHRLLTALTSDFEGAHYTAVLLYDHDEVVDGLFESLLGDVGPDRRVNVVDPENDLVYGRRIDQAGEFIVVQAFPSTFYKWRLQLAPASAAYYSDRAKTHEFTQVALIPLALAVIVLGLVVAYTAVVRERRLNRLKSEFIANVSHELKTPLSLIRMFGELFTMGRVTDEEKAKRYHRIILRETERLTALIDKVLDFSKIERGASAYEFERRDLAEVVDRAVDVYRHRIDELGARLEYEVEPDLPPVRIDEHAIGLALINLIDNAVKYARGTEVVGVELRRVGARIHLDVYDRGAGIPEEHLKRIFERFYRYQAEGLDTRGQRGSGIGLSLVRHIARAHGGHVIVTSTPRVETRFSIRLPLGVEDG